MSARHISFLESGRARPSPDMIARLSEALALPLDARNQMLTHAGFAPRYPGRAWDSDDMAPIRRAVRHTMQAHAPYPAIVLDRVWTILDMNTPAQAFYGMLGVRIGDSILDLMMSDDLPPLVENWPEVAHHACQRLRTESAAQGGLAVLDRAADHLAQVPIRKKPAASPVIPTILNNGTLRLSVFATVAQFGTPEDVALDDLRIELFFPADDASDQLLRSMAAT